MRCLRRVGSCRALQYHALHPGAHARNEACFHQPFGSIHAPATSQPTSPIVTRHQRHWEAVVAQEPLFVNALSHIACQAAVFCAHQPQHPLAQKGATACAAPRMYQGADASTVTEGITADSVCKACASAVRASLMWSLNYSVTICLAETSVRHSQCSGHTKCERQHQVDIISNVHTQVACHASASAQA